MQITKKLFKHSFLGIYATKILKGCLFLFTILVSVSDAEMTTPHLITYILFAFAAMTLIDIYCQYIGDQIRMRRALNVDEVWSLVGEILPQCVPGIFGILVFILPLFRILSQDLAFDSAWDPNWQVHYGDYDPPDPHMRRNFMPADFTPKQNPFYVQLPYSDVANGRTKEDACIVIPWFNDVYEQSGQSVLKGRWIAK